MEVAEILAKADPASSASILWVEVILMGMALVMIAVALWKVMQRRIDDLNMMYRERMDHEKAMRDGIIRRLEKAESELRECVASREEIRTKLDLILDSRGGRGGAS